MNNTLIGLLFLLFVNVSEAKMLRWKGHETNEKAQVTGYQIFFKPYDTELNCRGHDPKETLPYRIDVGMVEEYDLATDPMLRPGVYRIGMTSYNGKMRSDVSETLCVTIEEVQPPELDLEDFDNEIEQANNNQEEERFYYAKDIIDFGDAPIVPASYGGASEIELDPREPVRGRNDLRDNRIHSIRQASRDIDQRPSRGSDRAREAGTDQYEPGERGQLRAEHEQTELGRGRDLPLHDDCLPSSERAEGGVSPVQRSVESVSNPGPPDPEQSDDRVDILLGILLLLGLGALVGWLLGRK